MTEQLDLLWLVRMGSTNLDAMVQAVWLLLQRPSTLS